MKNTELEQDFGTTSITPFLIYAAIAFAIPASGFIHADFPLAILAVCSGGSGLVCLSCAMWREHVDERNDVVLRFIDTSSELKRAIFQALLLWATYNLTLGMAVWLLLGFIALVA